MGCVGEGFPEEAMFELRLSGRESPCAPVQRPAGELGWPSWSTVRDSTWQDKAGETGVG